LNYDVRITDKALRDISRLPEKVGTRLVQRIEGLRVDPRPPGSLAIAGHAGLFRIRQGDYRLVYAVIEEHLVVLVVRAGHRKEVYDRLGSLSSAVEDFRKDQLK
jgi:mRNA interferase RelE/StbE